MGIKVRNLTKNYGAAQAVNDISFDVQTGEIVGFLGPNGAGKTTTMKILTCYMPQTSGYAEVDGIDISKYPLAVRKKIGYLPEANPLYTEMNVIDFLRFSAKLQGIQPSMINSRIKEMLEIAGLKEVRHKDIEELSKGYRQRVGLAHAMIHDPDVLILDEPTSGLDPNQIIEIRNVIKRIGKEKTVILSTHILSEVQATCDRVVIINRGKIVADGSLDSLQENMQGQEIISLTLLADADPTDAILPVFKKLDNAESARFLGAEKEKELRFEITSPKGKDLREDIFRTIVEKGWVILEMNRNVSSLEDMFREFTLGQNPEMAAYSAAPVRTEIPQPEVEKSPPPQEEKSDEENDESRFMPK